MSHSCNIVKILNNLGPKSFFAFSLSSLLFHEYGRICQLISKDTFNNSLSSSEFISDRKGIKMKDRITKIWVDSEDDE